MMNVVKSHVTSISHFAYRTHMGRYPNCISHTWLILFPSPRHAIWCFFRKIQGNCKHSSLEKMSKYLHFNMSSPSSVMERVVERNESWGKCENTFCRRRLVPQQIFFCNPTISLNVWNINCGDWRNKNKIEKWKGTARTRAVTTRTTTRKIRFKRNLKVLSALENLKN